MRDTGYEPGRSRCAIVHTGVAQCQCTRCLIDARTSNFRQLVVPNGSTSWRLKGREVFMRSSWVSPMDGRSRRRRLHRKTSDIVMQNIAIVDDSKSFRLPQWSYPMSVDKARVPLEKKYNVSRWPNDKVTFDLEVTRAGRIYVHVWKLDNADNRTHVHSFDCHQY